MAENEQDGKQEISPADAAAAAIAASEAAKANAEGDAGAKAEGEAKGEAPVSKVLEVPPVKDQSAFNERKLQERIAKLTRQMSDLKTKVTTNTQDDEARQREIDRLAEEKANAKAEQIAAAREFSQRSVAVAEAGRELYGREPFDTSVSLLKQIIVPEDQDSVQRHFNLIAAAMETGEAPRLIVELSRDLEEADRLAKLSPVKLGIELAKLAAKQPEPVSKVPKPITPIGARGGAHIKIEPDDKERAPNLPIGDWMARRNAQVEERRKARNW